MGGRDAAERRLIQILRMATTFGELEVEIAAEYEAGAGAVFGAAQRFIVAVDAGNLDYAMRDRFAEALRRMPASARAQELLERLDG
jgi:hypothetical protein